ncbi:RNA polymerase sigma factor [Paenibacillus protaetiae]|uniref:RNA polymerase sigma factor n=1 Tax=Paenibacillus protaetiae TaxID=2509456 RepID=A0A4P6ETQ6_9BACL|nr:RNA polymerase sigma factor [Paenibacillus protaetiae]QAY66312.1 RNA polymerase sigma factor [Paenibacillus protaetiae]
MEQQPIWEAEQIRSALVRYCRSLTGSQWDAEDLAQETYMKALPFMASVRELANPSAYLFRMAKNRWIDQLRRSSKGAALEREAGGLPEAEEQSGIEQDDVEQALLMLIHHLTPLQRTVYLLREAVALPAKETAAMLQISEGAVKAALHRARIVISKLRTERGAALPLLEACQAGALGEKEHAVMLAYVAALHDGDAQAIAMLMQQQDEESRQSAAVHIRQQSQQRSIRSRGSGSPGTTAKLRMAA